jgi:hypothetical protein
MVLAGGSFSDRTGDARDRGASLSRRNLIAGVCALVVSDGWAPGASGAAAENDEIVVIDGWVLARSDIARAWL